MTHRLLGLQRPAHNARDLEYSDRLMPLSLAPASIAANSFSFTQIFNCFSRLTRIPS